MVELEESKIDGLDAETCRRLLPKNRSWIESMSEIYTPSILEGSPIEDEVKCVRLLQTEKASKSKEG